MTDERPETDDFTESYVGPDVPNEPDTAMEDGPTLTPEELDISDSKYVEPLDDNGRYVVSAGDGPPNVPESVKRNAIEGPLRDDRHRSSSTSGRQKRSVRSPEAARTLLAEELTRSNARYGLDIVGVFDGSTARHRTASDDVIATFENLVQWYAQHVSDGTPADEVIEILLREARIVDAETPNLAKLLERHDLEQSDSIAELVSAIRKESERR